MSGLPACMYTVCMPSLYEVQKRASNSLELELEMTVNQHVDAGTQTYVLYKTNKNS